MLNQDDIDPYALLDVPYSATGEEIQNAFQAKMAITQDSAPLMQAYGMIRSQSGRNHVRWDKEWSFLVNPFPIQETRSIDVVALAKELAFLSSWELGEDSCLQ